MEQKGIYTYRGQRQQYPGAVCSGVISSPLLVVVTVFLTEGQSYLSASRRHDVTEWLPRRRELAGYCGEEREASPLICTPQPEATRLVTYVKIHKLQNTQGVAYPLVACLRRRHKEGRHMTQILRKQARQIRRVRFLFFEGRLM